MFVLVTCPDPPPPLTPPTHLNQVPKKCLKQEQDLLKYFSFNILVKIRGMFILGAYAPDDLKQMGICLHLLICP